MLREAIERKLYVTIPLMTSGSLRKVLANQSRTRDRGSAIAEARQVSARWSLCVKSIHLAVG